LRTPQAASPKLTLKVLGLTVSRTALAALSALLFAIPALDMVVEDRDDGSTGDLGVDAYPSRTPGKPASPSTQPPSSTPAGPPSTQPPAGSVPPPTRRPVVHYDCGNDNSNIGKYVPAGRYWQNEFTAQGAWITGGWVLIGANTDGGDHRARVGVYAASGLSNPLAEVVVAVTGYDGESFAFPSPVHVARGQHLYLAVGGIGDFTAYDNRSGCFIGRVVGYDTS